MWALFREAAVCVCGTEKRLISSVAYSAKIEYSNLVNFVTKENRNEFLSFKKDWLVGINFFGNLLVEVASSLIVVVFSKSYWYYPMDKLS